MIKNLSKSRKTVLIICVILLIVMILSITLLFVYKNKYSSFEKVAYALDSADIDKDTAYTIIDDLEENSEIIDYILSNVETPEKLFSDIKDVEKINTLIDILKKNLTSEQVASFIHNLFTAPEEKGLLNINVLFKYVDSKRIKQIKSYKTMDYYAEIHNKTTKNPNNQNIKNKSYNLSLNDWNELTSSFYMLFDYFEGNTIDDNFTFINVIKSLALDNNYLENIPIKDLIFFINTIGKGLINIEDYNGIFNIIDYFLDDVYSTAIIKAPNTVKKVVNIASKINANDLMYIVGDYPHIEKVYNNVFNYFKTHTQDFNRFKSVYANEIANALNVFDIDKKYTTNIVLNMFDISRNIDETEFTNSELKFWEDNKIKLS